MKQLAAFLLMAVPLLVHAQQPVKCETTPYGVTKCSNGQVGVQQASGQTVWNGNTVATPNGNQSIFSNGTTATQNGNQITYSNGKTCVNNNGVIACR
jgi:hypothetical protein